MREWVLQPSEYKGGYTFSGKIYITKGVSEELCYYEISQIINDIKDEVKKSGSIDYLQVFMNNEKRKIYVIDSLSEEMKKESDTSFVKENDYFTILFSNEY